MNMHSFLMHGKKYYTYILCDKRTLAVGYLGDIGKSANSSTDHWFLAELLAYSSGVHPSIIDFNFVKWKKASQCKVRS